MKNQVLKFKSPVNFDFIFIFAMINTLGIFFSYVFFNASFFILPIVATVDLALVASIRTIVITGSIISVSNIFEVKKYNLTQLKYLKVYYRWNKYGSRTFILQFENKRYVLEFPDSCIPQAKEIIEYMRHQKVQVIIDSKLPSHDVLRDAI